MLVVAVLSLRSAARRCVRSKNKREAASSKIQCVASYQHGDIKATPRSFTTTLDNAIELIASSRTSAAEQIALPRAPRQ